MAGKSVAFSKAYTRLNPAQKNAVDTIEGPVMVVAGPGTGKTQILTLRIANIIQKTDTPPDAILALTFTESGAAAMRRRLLDIIGPAAYQVHLHTFHSFCNEIIARYHDRFPRIIGADPITDVQKISMLRTIIENEPLEHLKPHGDPFYYINTIRGSISEMKREQFSPEVLEMWIMRDEERFLAQEDLYNIKGKYAGKMKGKYESELRKIARTKEFVRVYRAYHDELATRRLYDFDDMILEVVETLQRDESLLLAVQEEFLYILADEHQDANAAQNKLLELLSNFHESPNLFIVGDEKQAIFRFQGASLENFQYFQRLFPEAMLIHLEENYRSAQYILDTAHTMIAADGAAMERVRLVARAPLMHEGTIPLHLFSNQRHEEAWVADEIAARIGEGVEPAEIAVLYRTNSESAMWMRALEDRGIHVSIESDQNALRDPEMRKLIALLRAFVSPGDDVVVGAALHVPFLGILPLDAYKIIRQARVSRVPIAEVWQRRELLDEAKVSDTGAIHAVYTSLESLVRGPGSVPEVVGTFIRASGFLTYVLSLPQSVELIEKLAGLMRDVEALAKESPDYTMAALVDHIDLLDAYGIPVRKEIRAAPRKGAVRLMTAHKSKGLEFDYVYVVNVADGVWGGRTSRAFLQLPVGGARGDDPDERRILYVALTRARHQVTMTLTQDKAGKVVLPSRFIAEMDVTQVPRIEHADMHDPTADLARERAPAKESIADKEFLNTLFREQGLSVTALNNYLTCPWRYFYSNLIRIPLPPVSSLLFGNAIDRALKQYFDQYRETGVIDSTLLTTYFTEALHRQPFAPTERDRVAVRGTEALRAWHTEWSGDFVRESISGYRVVGELSLPEGALPSVMIRGELDKLEHLPDGAVRVVDYKTGKTKSRNAIMGKTKNDDGGYYRQLAFYQLLLDTEGKHRFTEAMLDFIEPDSKGVLHREVFAKDELDREGLMAAIIMVSNEIWNLDFWHRRCGETKCEYCPLRDLMN